MILPVSLLLEKPLYHVTVYWGQYFHGHQSGFGTEILDVHHLKIMIDPLIKILFQRYVVIIICSYIYEVEDTHVTVHK